MAYCGEVSVRREFIGGGVSRVAASWPEHWISGHGQAVLLIHGYNNVKTAALKSYREVFTDSFARTGHVFWPGDTRGGTLISALSYPRQILHARESAERLADFLRRIVGPGGTPVAITLIAHSLGCRLVFELLRILATNPAPNVRLELVCLMAAALPVRLIDLDTTPAASAMEGTDRKVMIFHSVTDTVLMLAFPAGQLEAWRHRWETDYYFEAVGWSGAPFKLNEVFHYENAAHGDYWKSAGVADRIALRLGYARRRHLQPLKSSKRRRLLRRIIPRRYFEP